MENYIVINGKKAELTEEQLKALGIPTTSSPFGALPGSKAAFFISEYGVPGIVEADCSDCVRLTKTTNIFNDSEYAYQVALHQELYRKLLKFRCELGEEGGVYPLYYIVFMGSSRIASTHHTDEIKHFGEVYFNNPENAMRAKKEIVDPFLRKHPKFKWVM